LAVFFQGFRLFNADGINSGISRLFAVAQMKQGAEEVGANLEGAVVQLQT
jgi:hypothetical protein